LLEEEAEEMVVEAVEMVVASAAMEVKAAYTARAGAAMVLVATVEGMPLLLA
jgi:hypothetical protein